jgi:uncharacterized membrane protein HdeD (DUF308 family)
MSTMHGFGEGAFVQENVSRHWKWLLALGVIALIGGVFAILVPVAASISAAILAGWALLFGAVSRLVAVFRADRTPERLTHLALGLLYLVAGLYLLLFPVSGTITLTVVLVAYFLASGAVLLASAVQTWGSDTTAWRMFLGLLSIVLGVLIWADLPSSATWAIGLLIGIQLVFAGTDLIFIALAARDLTESSDHRTQRAAN